MHYHAIRARFRRTLLIVAAVLLYPAGTLLAQVQNPAVVPPQQVVEGMTYGQWSAAWWQWMLALPFGNQLPNPTFYATGQSCAAGQSGPVWFLAEPAYGTPDVGVIEQCKVPAGRYLMVPLLSAECSSLETAPKLLPSPCTDDASCRVCAKSLADSVLPHSLHASVDGISVTGLQERASLFRMQSPLFYFSVPQRNWFADSGAASTGTGYSVSDGYWLIIRPLSPGLHTVHVEAVAMPGFLEDVTYQLSVEGP